MSFTISHKLDTIGKEEEDDAEPSNILYRNTFLAGVTSLLFIFAMGMTGSYSAPATVDMKRPGSRMRGITADEVAWIGSLNLLGGIPANILGGYFTHMFGRKAVLMVFAPVFLSSWLIITYTSSVEWICVGKTMSGFCTGFYCIACQAYLSEIAPKEIRGLLSSLFPLANNLGILTVMGLGIILRWSWLAMSIAICITVATCLMFFMPESPSWLVEKSIIVEAHKSLMFLRGKQFENTKEIARILKSNSQQKDKISLKDFQNPIFYKPVGISFCLMLFHATSGFKPVYSFTVEIFQEARSALDPKIAATVLAAVQIIASAISGCLIDKFGRRKLYIVSGVGTCITLIVLGTHSLIINRYSGHHQMVGYIPLLIFIIYALVFTIGLGTLPFVMVAELVPIRYRSALLSIATLFIFTFSFVMTKVYHDMKRSLGSYGVYWTYASFTFLSVLFGLFLLPETKNLSIDEISKSFIKKKRASQCVK